MVANNDKTTTEQVDPAVELSKEFMEIECAMQSMTVGLMALSKRLKKLEKSMNVVIKQKSKKVKGVKKETATKIDNRLMKFMGLSEPITTRSEALRKISDYVRTSGLQVPDDKRTFTTDTTLAGLFGIPKGEKLTFLAINKHITPLFNGSKSAASVPPVAEPVVAPKKSKKVSKSKTAEK